MTNHMISSARMHGEKHHWGQRRLVFWVVIALMAALPSSVTAAEKEVEKKATAERPGNPEEPKDFVLTAEEFRNREARLSEPLRTLRQEYRQTRMINDVERLQVRMDQIAGEIEGILAGSRFRPEELPIWLELLQDAQFVAGNQAGAFDALHQRYAHLAERMDSDALIDLIIEEGEVATAKKHFELATAIYEEGEALADSSGQLFEVVMAQGRMHYVRGGADGAADYYYAVRDEYIKTAPEMAREAHFRIAVAYHQEQRLPEALQVLDHIQQLYPETTEAEKARHTKRGWIQQPWEVQDATPKKPDAISGPTPNSP